MHTHARRVPHRAYPRASRDGVSSACRTSSPVCAGKRSRWPKCSPKQATPTAHYGKGHLGDIEESYLHNQGFDEALFTPMNQITSLYNPQGNAANAVLGLHPEIYPPDPYRLDSPGLVPEGWVMNIEGKKGEKGNEWCGVSNECYDKMDTEAEKRTLAFIRKNAEAGKPFYVQYWPNFLNFLKPQMPKKTLSGGKVADSYVRLDTFVGELMKELRDLGVAENTLVIAMADNGPMVHNPPPGLGHDRDHVPWRQGRFHGRRRPRTCVRMVAGHHRGRTACGRHHSRV